MRNLTMVGRDMGATGRGEDLVAGLVRTATGHVTLYGSLWVGWGLWVDWEPMGRLGAYG